MALDKRIKRIFLESKGQYLGSIVLIVFSCFAFTLMTQFAGNFERLATEFQEAYVQEDAAFRMAESIDNLPELESATGALIEEGRTFDYVPAEGKTLRIFSRNDRVNLPAIIEGRGLSESGEILINPQFAATHGYNVGDEITILGKPFTIVGIAALPNYIYPLQSEVDMMPRTGFGIAVIGKEDFAALDQGSTFYAVKFNAADQHPRAQSIQFRELLSRGIDVVEWTNIEDNKRVNIVAAEIDILNMVSKAVPMAIFLLAGVMVGNIVWRLINREAAIIGALYAFGYKRKEIYRHYLMLPLLIAVIGGVIGTVLGTFPVRYMVSFMLEVFNIPLTGIEFDPGLIVLSLLLPVLILGGSGYLVIRKELKHSPVELMRGTEEKNKVNFLERRLNLDRFRFTTKFRIRDQLRSLSRLAFLLTGIAVATLLLQWGFSLKSSMDYLISDGNSAGIFDFEYEYKFDGLRYEPLPEGAEPFSAALFLPEDDDKRDFYVTGVAPDSGLLTPTDETGARLSTDQVIATKPVARLLNVTPGDTADIVRKLDGREFSVQVDSIADTYAGNFIFMPLADYNATFGMPAGSYWGAFSKVPLDIPENEPYSVVTLEEKLAGAEQLMAPVQSMIGFLSAVAFIIGVIVIYVVTSLVIEENRRTISLMKIFGYRKKEINSLILNSSTIIVVLGYVIGIPLTVAALGVLIQSMEDSVGLMLPPASISPAFILAGFVVVMLAYELSKLLCRKRVNAVSMSEALKSAMD